VAELILGPGDAASGRTDLPQQLGGFLLERRDRDEVGTSRSIRGGDLDVQVTAGIRAAPAVEVSVVLNRLAPTAMSSAHLRI
jgi:hypothetical protein